MSSMVNYTAPIRVKNNVTGALRTWRHLTVGGHVACVVLTGFGFLFGWAISGIPILSVVIATVYAVHAIVMAQLFTNTTE